MELVESGTKWLGPIPAHWELSKIGHCFEHRNEIVSDKDFEPLSVTKNGVLPQLETAAKSDNSDGRKLIRKGDFVINQRSDRKGSAGVSDRDGSCSVIYTVLEPTKYDPRYAHHLFRSVAFQEEFYRWGTGIVDDLWSTRYSLMKQIVCPVPPVEEQKAIADFLDRELLNIEANTSKQKALIELLVERKRALIAQAINSGLNTSQDAWMAKRLRHIATVESGSDYKEVEVTEGGYAVYGSGGEFTRASKYMHSGESVLLGRKGTIDRPLYVNEAFWTVDTMFWTRFRPGVHVKFIYYWATTLPFNLFKTSTALPSMTGTDLKNMPILLPPLKEQRDIATYLDEKTAAIDNLIAKAQEFLETTRQRQQALISAAVTGKIDIRGKN